MKANELKIGDLVAYKDKVGKVDVYVPPVLYVDAEGESISIILADSDLQPIPLTDEILEKNGWKKSPYGQFYTKDLFELRKWDKQWNFCVRNGHNILSIVSVHQLQHILWALGIDDNLKT